MKKVLSPSSVTRIIDKEFRNAGQNPRERLWAGNDRGGKEGGGSGRVVRRPAGPQPPSPLLSSAHLLARPYLLLHAPVPLLLVHPRRRGPSFIGQGPLLQRLGPKECHVAVAAANFWGLL
jgi:hypothetical protein